MKYIALNVAFAITALAQQPPATHLGAQRMGEKFKEWLFASHTDIEEVCKLPYTRECAELCRNRDSGTGSFADGVFLIGSTTNTMAVPRKA
jgi:hypothetical protein